MDFETYMNKHENIQCFFGFIDELDGVFVFRGNSCLPSKTIIIDSAVIYISLLLNSYASPNRNDYCTIPKENLTDLSEIAPVYICARNYIDLYENGNITDHFAI